jgi:arabinogalactan oligomer/maltooligosaccharide transport system permease protein
MKIWSGRRKALTIIAFLAPTLLGILVFNVFPIAYNTYISFTNRNQYHPNPDCSVGLTGVLEPRCWAVFSKNVSAGLGTPYRIQQPFYGNYVTLIGGLFNQAGLVAFLIILVCLSPLLGAYYLDRHYSRQITRPISSFPIWLAGIVLVVALAFILNFSNAINTVQSSGDFYVVVFRTILYVVLCVPLFFITGLILALILNNTHIKFRGFFRAVMIVPWAASTMAIMMSLIWQFFFRDQGTINQVLNIFGVKGPAWLNNPTYAFGIIVLVNLWYSFPFFFTVILGSLQSIPPDLYEAADVDGANYTQQLFGITLPLIRPAVLPAVVLSSITTFQMFGTVWAITQGGPSRGAGVPGNTELVMIYAYKQISQNNAYGMAGAFAVIVFIFLFIATIYSLRITRITQGAYE